MNKKYTLQRQATILIMLLILPLVLVACGFQLRGQTVALPFKSLYLLAPEALGKFLALN